jgi:hypothetical protein
MNKGQYNNKSYNKYISNEYTPILCCSTSIDKSNYYAWYEWWSNEIGKFGEEYQEQFNECMSISFNVQQELLSYPLQSELSVDKDYYLPTQQQRIELTNIIDDDERSYKKKEYFIEWAESRAEQNLLIRSNNIDNKKHREILIEKASKMKDKLSKLISDIMSSIDRNTQDLIKSYRRPFNEGERELLEQDGITIESGSGSSEPKYTYSNAIKTGNWFHIFEAAKAVTVTKLNDGLSGLVVRERQNTERSKLESLQWTSGSWTKFRRLFKNQLDTCEAVGCDLTDLDKMIALMSSLNKQVFYSVLSDYSSTTRRNNLPQTYIELTVFIENKYMSISASNDGIELIKRVENKRHEESVLLNTHNNIKSNTESNSDIKSKHKCDICSKTNHKTKYCYFRKEPYTIEQNRDFYI